MTVLHAILLGPAQELKSKVIEAISKMNLGSVTEGIYFNAKNKRPISFFLHY